MEHHPALFEKVGGSMTQKHNLQSFHSWILHHAVWAFEQSVVSHYAMLLKVGCTIANSDNFRSMFMQKELSFTARIFPKLKIDRPCLQNWAW